MLVISIFRGHFIFGMRGVVALLLLLGVVAGNIIEIKGPFFETLDERPGHWVVSLYV